MLLRRLRLAVLSTIRKPSAGETAARAGTTRASAARRACGADGLGATPDCGTRRHNIFDFFGIA
jgi:hypothetical protein